MRRVIDLLEATEPRKNPPAWGSSRAGMGEVRAVEGPELARMGQSYAAKLTPGMSSPEQPVESVASPVDLAQMGMGSVLGRAMARRAGSLVQASRDAAAVEPLPPLEMRMGAPGGPAPDDPALLRDPATQAHWGFNTEPPTAGQQVNLPRPARLMHLGIPRPVEEETLPPLEMSTGAAGGPGEELPRDQWAREEAYRRMFGDAGHGTVVERRAGGGSRSAEWRRLEDFLRMSKKSSTTP